MVSLDYAVGVAVSAAVLVYLVLTMLERPRS